jgi:fluoride exporter
MALLVAAGGAIGAPLRLALTLAVTNRLPRPVGFPWATLAINTAGSFLLGLLVWLPDGALLGEGSRAFLGTGILGAFTTYSAYSVETLLLVERGQSHRAILYAAGAILLCVLAAFAGMALARGLG